MTRDQILTAISSRLDPDLADRTLSRIAGTLAELDALPPYPQESAFQCQLSQEVYPFLAAAQALEMEVPDASELVCELVRELYPASTDKPHPPGVYTAHRHFYNRKRSGQAAR